MELPGVQKMKKWLKLTAVISVVVALAGCSAGGQEGTTSSGGSGSGSGSTTTPTITVALSSSTVTTASPATVTATLKDAAGAAISGNVVNFSVTSTVGLLSATSALTNSSGQASVLLSPATASAVGADTLNVTSTVAGVVATGSVGYQTSAVTAGFGTFTTDLGATSAAALAAYGQSDLTLTLTGVSSASPAALTLTSDCISRGKASISPATTTNTTGTATFIYKDTGGCGSVLTADTISASVTGSSTAPATVKVYLTPPTVNSITFNAATPATIYLKGSGYVESSQVSFIVVDTAGNPLPGQAVTLNLSTFAGGVLLDQQSTAETKTSDANGIVSGIVNSGTVPTPVRVIATLQNTSISTVSSNLAIVTGLPSQLHFSLSQQTINVEGFDRDGTANSYTVLAADRSGNPVPDGTSIIFWAEGGQIQGSATTAVSGGIASATASFVSQSPRPADGRVTILAYAIGEESFIDLNGDNVWEAGEPFQDLGDVVKDVHFDGIFDPANDEYVSLSQISGTSNSQTCSDQTATYPQFAVNNPTAAGNDFTPSRPGTCDGTWSGKTYVRRSVETVFSSSTPDLLWAGRTLANVPNSGLDSSCTVVAKYTAPSTLSPTQSNFYEVFHDTPTNTNDSTWYSGSASTLSGVLDFIVGDDNVVRLNPMPAGTVIAVANASTGLTVTLLGGSPVANTSSATSASVSYAFSGVTSGSFGLTVTTPKGQATTYTISVKAAAAPIACTL
jgi:hypothetical protein